MSKPKPKGHVYAVESQVTVVLGEDLLRRVNLERAELEDTLGIKISMSVIVRKLLTEAFGAADRRNKKVPF